MNSVPQWYNMILFGKKNIDKLMIKKERKELLIDNGRLKRKVKATYINILNC